MGPHYRHMQTSDTPLNKVNKDKNNTHWVSSPLAVLCLHCHKQKKIGAGFPSGSKHLIEP